MTDKLRALLAVLMGALFIYAGAAKVTDPARFFADIQNYDLLPWRAAVVAMAFYLPWLEIVCGVGMIFRRFRSGASLVLAGLLVVFIGALALAWARGLNISCGCFGGSSEHPRYFLWIGRDLALLAAALFAGSGGGKHLG
ncbi:MAG: MauE/DoxX family redox-associated membrane protein [Verrucomicrobiota bacterium]